MDLNVEYIEFNRDEIPVSKKIDIDGKLFTIEIQYNEVADFYTAIVYDNTDTPLISSKLVYMGNILHANMEGIPERKLVPLNITDLAEAYPGDIKVNYETFGDSVGLYLI